MLFVYNLGIAAYFWVLKIASWLQHRKAQLWVEGRHNFFAKLEAQVTDNQHIIWFHCASLGEFEQGRPLLEAIKKEQPTSKILLTFFSPSGYEIRKNYAFADYVCYLPLDTARNARQFLDLVQPKMVFFIKYEFWYHFLNQLHQRNIPTYLVAAIFRPNQLFFKWYGSFFKQILSFFTLIFLQEKWSSSLKLAPTEKYTLAGDTRIDRVAQLAANVSALPLVEAFCKNKKKIIVAGSTWGKDEAILKAYMLLNSNEGEHKWQYIVAPHEIPSAPLTKNAFPIPTICYSETIVASNNVLEANDLLFIDNVGMLSSIYQYGQIAYIGGGFGSGIHNTLEPIAFGLPVIFGPKYKKFAEANYLVASKGGFCVQNVQELAAAIAYIEANYEQCSQAAKAYILEHQGATQKIMQTIDWTTTLPKNTNGMIKGNE
jgi:3-deoxy-D-manno-octulosonic-acid transferase